LSAKAPAIYWTLLVALTLAVGFAASGSREPLLVGRHCAMAFVVAGAVPALNVTTLLYLVGAVLLNALTRSTDYLLFGRMPLLTPQIPSRRTNASSGIRFALAFAVMATMGMWIGDRLGEQHGYWIVITTLVVMLPDVRSSSARIVQRIGGTLAGVAAAWVITTTIHSEVAICTAILIVALLIPHHLRERYWLHTGLIALMVLLAYDLAQFNLQGLGRLPIERIEDILIGCAMALIGTAAALPSALIHYLAVAAHVRDRKHGAPGRG
jgi:hypothetical protein